MSKKVLYLHIASALTDVALLATVLVDVVPENIGVPLVVAARILSALALGFRRIVNESSG